MSLACLEEVDGERWDAFVADMATGHLLQTHLWGQFKARYGWRPYHLAVERGGRIVAGALMLFRPLPVGTLAYIPKGPLCDPADSEAFSLLLSTIHQRARQAGAIFTRIEPDWEEDPALAQWLEGMGFRLSPQTIQPRSTLHLDLRADLETLLARMKSKTRYNIRLAERKGVEVREGASEDFPTFYRLSQITSQRDSFAIHQRGYYQEAWYLFAPVGMCTLLLASYQSEILAGLMAFACGRKAWYMYGASSNRHRNLMPNHLLQWEAIKWAKGRGCHFYDLWGIPDEVGADPDKDWLAEKRKGGMWGVYRFKQGFGGRVVRYIGAYDYVYRPLLYRLVTKVLAMWPL
ncbi:MAG: lipid II:glycine glycyltransferase FemX [Anaerolineae bacterium]